MDPDIGDLTTGDVLIEDDKIAAVEASIDADAEVVDCTGKIVIPGFVDTHRHTWETAIRNCAPNATLDDYFVEILDTFAPLYRAEDVYSSNLAGSLECLNAGITTLVDWSHINNTPEHADAAIQGLKETGIRAQYAYGSANTSLEKYWFFSAEAIPGDDVRRVRSTHFPGDDGLITMGLATRGPGSPRTRWCRPSGSWPASSASRSPCTSAWAGWPAGSGWSSSSTGSACSVRTRRTSTAATSATTSGSGSPTPAAPSRSPRRWRPRWDTAGRRSTRPASSGCGRACRSTS